MALKRMKALILLGFQFFAHFLLKIFGKRRGLTEFQSQYSADHVVPFSQSLRAQWPLFEKCLYCRLCDAACPDRTHKNFAAFPGPSYVLASQSRYLSSLVQVSPAEFDCAQCDTQACEAACPEGIPIASLMTTLQKMAGGFCAN